MSWEYTFLSHHYENIDYSQEMLSIKQLHRGGNSQRLVRVEYGSIKFNFMG